MRTTLRLAGTAAAIAGLAFASAGTAAAQNAIPGDNNAGTVVRVDPGLATVVVNPAAATATAVTGTFTNKTGASLTCEGLRYTNNQNTVVGDNAGTVAEAKVVQAALDYYKNFPLKPDLGVGFTPVVAGSSIPVQVYLDDVQELLPGGSVAPLFGDAFAARSAIDDAYSQSKLNGWTGQVPQFTVANNATYNWSATLGNPSTGTRTDFQAGVFFLCDQNSGAQYFAFAGYEGGQEPARTGNGTLQSGSLGHF